MSINPLAIDGIACVEFSAPSDEALNELGRLFGALGFSRTEKHRELQVDRFVQGQIDFLVARGDDQFGRCFSRAHGPCISSMGWWVDDAAAALQEAVKRGARPFTGDGIFAGAPAIYGIGDSLIYLLEKDRGRGDWRQLFQKVSDPKVVPSRGFTVIDHLTNNVEKGTLQEWSDFYKRIFGFTDVRTFDIQGEQTGLKSYALRSPCGKFCIPINEGNEEKSQIEEYLREYRGPGIQHLALLSDNLLSSLTSLEVPTLDIDADYYQSVFDRVPGVIEDHAAIEQKKVLVDGDEQGYLLQIFTRNVIGPIFFEMIQRRNHLSFGEGNFGALFRSIERDQERRGVL